MKKSNTRLAALAALVVGLGAASSAQATWTFAAAGSCDGTANHANCDANGDTLAKTSYTSGSQTLTISGAYAANDTSDNTGFSSGATWVSNSSSRLTYYSGGGIGMSSDGDATPNHALDNNGTNTEAVLLSFSSSVMLTSIGLGYVNGDADISLFRYTGIGTPTIAGTSASGMAGWSLVGNYGDLDTDTSNPYNLVNKADAAGAATSNSVGSSWWLITAYNTAYGSTSANGGSLGQGSDYYKLFAVAASLCTDTTTPGRCGPTTTNKAPEPGSLALVSLGLVGALGLRRRPLAPVAA